MGPLPAVPVFEMHDSDTLFAAAGEAAACSSPTTGTPRIGTDSIDRSHDRVNVDGSPHRLERAQE